MKVIARILDIVFLVIIILVVINAIDDNNIVQTDRIIQAIEGGSK